MAFIYLPIVIVTLVTLLYSYFTRTFDHWKCRGVIGPAPVPIFGNLIQTALRRKNMGVLFKELYNAFPNEKVVGIYMMTTPCLLIRDLDIIKQIMIKDFNVFTDRGVKFSKEGLGTNLFHADGDTWRGLRNRFTPIFTSGKLKNMIYIITKCGDDLVNYIDDICAKSSEHNVYTIMQKYTMTTISACAFGLELDIRDNQQMNTLKKLDKSTFNVNYARELDLMYPGILNKLNISLMSAYAHKFFYSLVKDVMKQRNGMPSSRNDFMDLLLEIRQQNSIYGKNNREYGKQLSLELTDNVIAAQAFIFYVAGYETSASTMSFMLHELAKNPDIQEKLIADIDRVLEKYKGNVTYETLRNMTYLNKVLDETLRLYPLVEPIQRNAQVDYEVPGTKLTIKKGTTVYVSAFGIQCDNKYYSDPEKFDPERYTSENSKDRHPCAYIPFGIGPRNCIGMRFAKMQSQVCMVKFFSKFRVQMTQQTPTEVQICPRRVIIGPKNGIHLDIIKR